MKNRKETPDIILVCEHDDGPGVGGLQEAADYLVEFPRPGFPRDLQRLSDTHTTYRDTERELGFVHAAHKIRFVFSKSRHFLFIQTVKLSDQNKKK